MKMKGKIFPTEHSPKVSLNDENSGTDHKFKSTTDQNITMKSEKKKKRKHESNKTSTESKKIKVETENINRQNDNDDNLEKNEISKNECDTFTGKFLKNSLISGDGLSALQRFVTVCNENTNTNLISEYLDAGGNVLEILRLLDTSEKKDINTIHMVFSATYIILIKILAVYPQKHASTEEACHHLINKHFSSIHLMLSNQSKPKHRKIVLKLLAAIVSLGGTLPRELLTHLTLHSQLLEILVSHSKPTDEQSVRTCFIHFVLAFLIEGNTSNIRALLDKRDVFSSIFSGFIYDYSDLVQIVLTTVKKYILENRTISKTTKLHTFSTRVIQDIVNLYNWKGPKNWPGNKKQKLETEHIDLNEKEITVNAVHEFLLTLLTSAKHGVAFHDRSLGTDSDRKHNQLINTVLQSLDKPWEHEKPSELVIRILTACPDLIKFQLLSLEPFLVPRRSKKWISVIGFVTKIINNIDVENCLKLGADITTTQLVNGILNLILPSVVINSAINPSLESNSVLIHHEIINLLLTIIRKVKQFIKAVENGNFNDSEISAFKTAILENAVKHMPSFETILNIWIKAFTLESENNSDDNNEDAQDLQINIKNHVLSILDLLEAYSETCPEILLTTNSINTKKSATLLLTNLSNIPNTSEEELTIMKVKALKILLCSNVDPFSSKDESFKTALTFLITNVGNKNISLDLQIRQTINLLLNICGIFEGCNDEIDIWIDSITYFESFNDKLEIANWITKIIKYVSNNTEKCISLIHETERNINEEILDTNKQEDIFNELSERDISDIKLMTSMLPLSSISLLLYAAVENLKISFTNVLAQYMSHVLIHTLHCQISTTAFISLVTELNIPAQKYLTSWSNENSPISIKKPFVSKNIFRNISKILLNSNEEYTINVKETQICIQLDENVEYFSLTNFEVKALTRMVIFYLTQLLRKQNKAVQNILIYNHILLALLKVAKEIDNASEDLIKDCANSIFKNPLVLQYFKGLYKNKDSADCKMIKLFIEVCTFFVSSNKQSLIAKLLYPYQEKFIMQLQYSIKKHQNKDQKKEIKTHTELIKLLQLDIKVVNDLLSSIMRLSKEKYLTLDKSDLSVWGILIPKLLEQFSIEEFNRKSNSFIMIQNNDLKKLFFYLIELKHVNGCNVDSLEDSIYEYLLKFPSNISIVDEKIFTALVKANVNATNSKMLNLLIQRNSKFINIFVKYVNNNEDILKNENLIFSILSSNLVTKWNEEFLKKLYMLYKKSIYLFLTEPKVNKCSWIYENINTVAYLIENSCDTNTCKELCDAILSDGTKLDEVELEHVKLFHILFKKCVNIKPDALKDFIQVLLRITVIALKKDAKNIKKLDYLCKLLFDSINDLKLNNESTFEELSKNYFWPQFTRMSLKVGLKTTKDDKKCSYLLKALFVACDSAYKDNSSEEYVKTIFEMTTSHSEFVNVMLSNDTVKSDVTELLWILVKKNYEVMLANHIPLYLSSYNATLCRSDQFILKILQHYEINGIKLDDYQPYIWGNTATSHYCIKGETDTALWRQPSTSQIFDLLIPEIVTNTIKNFPVKRNKNLDSIQTFDSTQQVYDPVFYLPIFTQLLAEHNVVACHKVIHSGALALTIMACSSTCEQIRLAAFTVISRFYFHLEATSSKEKLLWINFIDLLRNGIIKSELALDKIRLNGFVATFLARTCMVMTLPLNPLYTPLQAFLMAKPALDLNSIPEFLQLYHSSEIEHKAHRKWILELVSDGIKIDNDTEIALKYVLFKMLLDFYNSTLSDIPTKNLILQAVKSTTKLPKSCMILINGYALLPWLITISENLSNRIDSITHILDIVNNILNVFHETRLKDTYYYLMLMKVLICLKRHFNHNLSIECLGTFINVLNRTLINNTVCSTFTKDDMKEVVNISKQLLKDVNDCEVILQFGCKFIEKEYLKINNDTVPQESLRRLIINWHNYVKIEKQN